MFISSADPFPLALPHLASPTAFDILRVGPSLISPFLLFFLYIRKFFSCSFSARIFALLPSSQGSASLRLRNARPFCAFLSFPFCRLLRCCDQGSNLPAVVLHQNSLFLESFSHSIRGPPVFSPAPLDDAPTVPPGSATTNRSLSSFLPEVVVRRQRALFFFF